eukprot:SAG31_NODE_35539_length_322_cov_0.690583_1_plen_77_part_01
MQQACPSQQVPSNAPTDHVSFPPFIAANAACCAAQGWDPDCWHAQVKAAAAAVAPLPFYLTEYNVGCCLGYPQHDTS